MIGRIEEWSGKRQVGVIRSEHDQRVGFAGSVVAEDDLPRIAPGDLVIFELTDSRRPQAEQVRRYALVGQLSRAERKAQTQWRYQGFDQQGSLRMYRFQRVVPGVFPETFQVRLDLTLLPLCNMSLQEGPALCSHLLAGQEETAADELRLTHATVTEQDVLAYHAARPKAKVTGTRPVPPGSTGRSLAAIEEGRAV